MTAPALEPRRPGAAHVAGFAALLAAVAGAIAVLSAAPWQATRPDAAVVRVAFKHVARADVGPAAGLSEAELAKLPPHMRPQGAVGLPRGRRADTTLHVRVDDRVRLTRTYRPTGFRRDGPTFGYEEVVLAPGRHRLDVVVTDGDRARPAEGEIETPGRWRLIRDVEVQPGQALLIELVEGQGLVIR